MSRLNVKGSFILLECFSGTSICRTVIRMHNLLHDLKSNLVLEHDEDDLMLRGYLTAAIDYAESYQHREPEYYDVQAMSASTRQAVLLLASHFYESRDGST